jgi:hypothetical protein
MDELIMDERMVGGMDGWGIDSGKDRGVGEEGTGRGILREIVLPRLVILYLSP